MSWEKTRLGENPVGTISVCLGRKLVWEKTLLEQYPSVLGENPVGTISVCLGRKPVWEKTRLGEYAFGRIPLWDYRRLGQYRLGQPTGGPLRLLRAQWRWRKYRDSELEKAGGGVEWSQSLRSGEEGIKLY